MHKQYIYSFYTVFNFFRMSFSFKEVLSKDAGVNKAASNDYFNYRLIVLSIKWNREKCLLWFLRAQSDVFSLKIQTYAV